MKMKLMSPLIFLLTLTLTLSTYIHNQTVKAQPATLNLDFLKCAEYCRQLPTDYKYQNLKITQRLINKLPKWGNICEELTGKSPCSVGKSYKFKDGVISVKIQGTEAFYTDIKFNAEITSQKALNIAKKSFNNGKYFDKIEILKNRTVLYSSPFDYGDEEPIYLEETYLVFNFQDQVVRIVSVSNSP
ncbi:MAG: hypothetical protein F6K62_24495 [Sphaerospermopsis sp. SIO1G2]|nr:hypothetical protein [Sphaerospermopsis sp. SIO1G2]